MKKSLLFVAVIIINLFSSDVYAQGWLWGRGNTGGGNDAWGVAADPSGNVFVSGITLGAPNIFSGHVIPQIGVSSLQVVVVKYDPYGNYVWGIGTQNGSAWLINLAADQFGNSYLYAVMTSAKIDIGGETLTNSNYPSSQYMLVKFDPKGNVVWARNAGTYSNYTVSMPPAYILGGGGVTTDDTSNVYISGNFSKSPSNFDGFTLNSAGGDDMFVVKYDSLGNMKWATSIGDSLTDNVVGITVTHQGNVYIAGITKSAKLKFGDTTIINPTNKQQIAVIGELNNAGTPIWGYGFGSTKGTCADGVASDINNNVYLTGGFNDTTITFPTSKVVTNPNPGKSSLYLAKFKPDNTVEWTKVINSLTGGTVWGFCIAMSPCGAIWVSGNCSKPSGLPAQLAIDGNVLTTPAGDFYDPVFIAGFTTAGAVAGYDALASGSDDQNGIACDYSGNVYMCADYLASPSGAVFKVGKSSLATGTPSEWLYVGKYASVNTSGFDTVVNGIDTIVCTLDTTSHPVTLHAPPGYKIYKWGDTSFTGDTRVINKAGKYWVLAVGNCSSPTTIDTFRVSFGQQIVFSLSKDTTLKNVAEACKRVILKAPEVVKGVSYLWQDGNTTQLDTALHSGTYYVKISKGVCSYTDTMNVNIYHVSAHLRDTFLCKELPINVPLSVNPSPGANVMWSTLSTQPSITVTDTGIYWVTVKQGPCMATDTMHLTHEFCDCWSTAPSAFTPNGDGRNDVFRPVIQPDCPLKSYMLTIYDRYGQRVFSTTYPKVGWDGTYRSNNADMGVYFWEMQYYGGVSGTKHYMKGDLTLIR